MNLVETIRSRHQAALAAHATSKDDYASPTPILQWLIVIVLSIHVMLTEQTSFGLMRTDEFVFALLIGNLALVRGLPFLMSWSEASVPLVLIDSLLVPFVLLETGVTDTSFYVVFFGIIMIAGASGSLKRALVLSLMICATYGLLEFGKYMLLGEGSHESLAVVLLRMPFFLALSVYYGALAEFAQEQREDKERFDKQAREIRSLFSRYVSPRVVEQLVKDPSKAKIGGERKELTMLFCDLVGYTSFSEKHSAEDVVEQLNEYFTAMTEVIFRWDGTLDKFVGDEIVVFWGAPIDQPNHVELTVKCALHMRHRLSELQKKWREEKKVPLNNGIGIHTGSAVVGNIGAEGKKMEYTMTGDAVNLASRIQGLTRHFECPIIITEDTAVRLKILLESEERDDNRGRLGHVWLRKLRPVKVMGKDRPVVVYALESKKRGEQSVIEELASAEILEIKDKQALRSEGDPG